MNTRLSPVFQEFPEHQYLLLTIIINKTLQYSVNRAQQNLILFIIENKIAF